MDGPPPFPILQLPRSVIEHCLRLQGLSDILTFSLLSSRCAAHVQNALIDPVVVHVNPRETVFVIQTPGSLAAVHWTIPTHVARRRFTPIPITVGHVDFDCSHFENCETSVKTVFRGDERLAAVASAVAHIDAVFQRRITTINFDARYFTDNNVWNSLPACENVHIVNLTNRHQLDGFFRGCTVQKKFKITGVFPHMAAHFNRVSRLENVEISWGEWFRGQHLGRVECRNITVHNAGVTSAEVHVFISEWMEDNSIATENIRIGSRDHVFDRNTIWQGDWTVHSENEKFHTVDELFARKRLELQRATDNAVMELIVSDEEVAMKFTYPNNPLV